MSMLYSDPYAYVTPPASDAMPIDAESNSVRVAGIMQRAGAIEAAARDACTMAFQDARMAGIEPRPTEGPGVFLGSRFA